MKLTANPNYWNGEPAIKNVEIVACIDDATALIALQTGELDIASQIGKAAYAQTATMDGVTGVSFNGWQNSGLFDFVDDVNFRQAVFHAINRDTLVDQSCRGKCIVWRTDDHRTLFICTLDHFF